MPEETITEDLLIEAETLWWTFGPRPKPRRFDEVAVAKHVKNLFEAMGYSVDPNEIRVETDYNLLADGYYVHVLVKAFDFPGLEIKKGVNAIRVRVRHLDSGEVR